VAADTEVAEPSHIIGIAKQTIVYGLGGVAIQAVGVLTLPIYARVFSPSEYGVLELAITLAAVVGALVDAGFASAAQRSFYDYTDEQRERRRRVIATALAFTTALAAVALIVLIAASRPISDWLLDGRGREALIALAVSVPLVNGANFLRETMRLRFRAWHYVVSSVLAAVATAGIGIVAVVGFDRGVEGVFIGVIVGNALAAVYGAIVVRADVGRRLSGDELRKMLAYGIPLVPVALAAWALLLVDRIMLSKLGSLSEVGEYAVANRVANVLLLAVTGFVLAFGPYVFSIHQRDPELEKDVRSKTLTYLTVALCAAGLVLTLFAREIISLVAPAFDTAYEAVGLLSLSVVAFGFSSVVMAGISIVRQTKVLAVLSTIGAAFNIGLNFAVIPPFGMVGAAFATAAAYVLLAGLYYRSAQRLYRTPYELPKVLLAIALASGIGVLGVLPLGPTAVAVPVKLAALAGFVVLLRATGVVSAERVRGLLGGMLRLRPAQA
jgi:O-antigen/teichoic acid export membrane protein